MEAIALGSSTTMVSRIGFGCAAMGGYDYGTVSDETSTQAVHKALDLGITLFDTADVYGFGHAEEVLGHALGSRRAEAFVATKVGVRWDEQGRTKRDLSPGWIREALEQSLRRLKVERISLYQIHWPDPSVPLEETLGELRRLQEAGKIQFVGCCNFDSRLLDAAQAHLRLESLQLPYSLVERQRESTIRESVERHHVSVLCYSPLGQGLLTGRYDRSATFHGTDLRQRSPLFQGAQLDTGLSIVERLRTIGIRYDRTPAQVAIRWLLQAPGVGVVCTGIKRPAQVIENSGASGWSLSSEDLRFLAGESAH